MTREILRGAFFTAAGDICGPVFEPSHHRAGFCEWKRPAILTATPCSMGFLEFLISPLPCEIAPIPKIKLCHVFHSFEKSDSPHARAIKHFADQVSRPGVFLAGDDDFEDFRQSYTFLFLPVSSTHILPYRFGEPQGVEQIGFWPFPPQIICCAQIGNNVFPGFAAHGLDFSVPIPDISLVASAADQEPDMLGHGQLVGRQGLHTQPPGLFHAMMAIDHVEPVRCNFRQYYRLGDVGRVDIGLIEPGKGPGEIIYNCFRNGEKTGIVTDVSLHLGDVELKDAVRKQLVPFLSRAWLKGLVGFKRYYHFLSSS